MKKLIHKIKVWWNLRKAKEIEKLPPKVSLEKIDKEFFRDTEELKKIISQKRIKKTRKSKGKRKKKLQGKKKAKKTTKQKKRS